MELGFARVAVVSPELRVADVAYNVVCIVTALEELATEGTHLAVFPELCITGYSCADLFYQEALLRKSLQGLQDIATVTSKLGVTAVVAFPLAVDGRLYNCAALLANGLVAGVVPKTYLPNTKEYYEGRWFASGRDVRNESVLIGGREVPFGTDLLFRASNFPGCVVGIEICEDLWAGQPPSGPLSLAGATVIVNPSASNELLGKMQYRRDLVRQQSARCMAAYLYAGAGPCESTTDTVFGGHSMIVENGAVLAETERFRFETQIATADVDLQQLVNERLGNSCFSADLPPAIRSVPFELSEPAARTGKSSALRRTVLRQPFVPYDRAERARN
jgi:NAD+ synthase (glutamine-hydrolysing)